MKIRFTVSLAVVMAALASHAQQPAALEMPYKSVHWKAQVSLRGNMTMPSECWYRHPGLFRSVNAMGGMSMVMVMTGNDVFTWPDGGSAGMKFNRSSMPQSVKAGDAADMVKRSQDWLAHGKKIGSEAVNGRPCDIYEVNENSAKGKVWLWTKNHFPLRTVMQMGEMATEMTVTDVEMDAPLADALFQPPANVKFSDLSSLMQGLPNLQQLQKLAPQQ